MADDVRRRFRLVALSYVIFAAFVVAGVWINYQQSQDIKHNAQTTCKIVRELAKAEKQALPADLQAALANC